MPRRRYHRCLSFTSPAFPPFPGPRGGPGRPASSCWAGVLAGDEPHHRYRQVDRTPGTAANSGPGITRIWPPS